MAVMFIVDFFSPIDQIDIAEDFNTVAYKENPEKFGDHMFDVQNYLQKNSDRMSTKQFQSTE